MVKAATSTSELLQELLGMEEPDASRVSPCVQWLRERPTEVDRVLGIVIGRLCDMRHSLVHESWPVMMVAEYEAGVRSPSYSPTLLDVYPCAKNDPELFRSYVSGVSLERFKAISTAAARNHLLAAYP